MFCNINGKLNAIIVVYVNYKKYICIEFETLKNDIMNEAEQIQNIKDCLLKHYDYIGKLDAMKFIKKMLGQSYTIALTCKAYDSIDEYN